MMRNMLLLLLMISAALFGSAEVIAICPPACDQGTESPDKITISENDTYLDLNSGKTFRFDYDELNEKFNRGDLLSLDLYVNTRTMDTFWLEDAVLVNNALRRDAAGAYKVDPMKVKRDGNGYKVINNKADNRVKELEKADNQKEDNTSSI